MPLCFLTISLPCEKETAIALRILNETYQSDLRYLVREYGKNESHLHYHALLDLPSGIASNTRRLATQLKISSVYGIKIVIVKSSKIELAYAGYMQKEIYRALPADIRKKRTGVCIYGDQYLDRAYKYYLANPTFNKSSQKDSYDGTLLANKIVQEYDFKGYDQALYCVYDYASSNQIDVKRPDSIANMMLQIKRMEKLKVIPKKKSNLII